MGIRLKFQSGGGEVMDHSRVRPSQGSPSAGVPDRVVLTTFARNTRRDAPIKKAPIVASRFHRFQPRSGAYVYTRRGIPRRPKMCMGKNATLKPISVNQKWILPSRSSSILPKTFGHQ